jgi:chromosome segregation ATPase
MKINKYIFILNNILIHYNNHNNNKQMRRTLGRVSVSVTDKNKIKKGSSTNITNSNSNKPQQQPQQPPQQQPQSTTADNDNEITKNKQHIDSLEKELETLKKQINDASCALDKTNKKIEDVDNAKKKKNDELEKAKSKCDNEREIKEILQNKCRDLERQIRQLNHQQREENEEHNNNHHQLNEIFNLILMSRQRENERREPGMNLQEIEKIKVDKYKHNNNNDTQQCNICGFELCNNDFVMTLPKCKHLFHKECLVNKLQQTGQCPLCKMKVNN